jgi:hypothetical protein
MNCQTRDLLSHIELDIRFYSTGAAVTDGRTDHPLLSVPAGEISNYPFPKPLVDFLGILEANQIIP